eukprot:124896-Pyramimonas_sp.AAC.1
MLYYGIHVSWHTHMMVYGAVYLGVKDLHREAAAGDAEDGCVVEILRELLRVQRGGGDQQLDVGAEPANVLRGSTSR